jgi:hypothetical protein
MRRVATAVLLCFMSAISTSAVAAERLKTYTLRFPAEYLRWSDDLAIDRLRIVVACGEFVAIEHIPSDWNIGTSRPISGHAGFDAHAGHGASALRDLSAFDATIVVSSAEESCLGTVKATASSMRGEWEREIVGIRLVERRTSR